MGNQFVMVNEGDDKNIDCEEVTVSGVVVQRQRMQIAGAADVAIAAVQATAVAGTEQGLVVRPIEQAIAANSGSSPGVFKIIGAIDSASGDVTQILGTNSYLCVAVKQFPAASAENGLVAYLWGSTDGGGTYIPIKVDANGNICTVAGTPPD